jgi:hypothetical protein
MKRISWAAVLLLVVGTASIAAAPPETTLGGIALGDKYQTISKRFPMLPAFKSLEEVPQPYPLNVLDKEPARIVESPSLNLVIYLNRKTAQVKALVTFEATGSAPQQFETGGGLRVGDSMQTARLLYGDPVKVSSYVYYYPSKTKIEEKIYYYQNLCLHTKVKDTSEVITSIVLGKYLVDKTLLASKQPITLKESLPIPRKTVTAIVPRTNTAASGQRKVGQTKVTPIVESVPPTAKKNWKWFKVKGKPPLAVMVTESVQVTPEETLKPVTPKKPKPVVKKPEVLVEQKIEVAERVVELSPEFKTLILQQQWKYKIRFNEKTQELVMTFRMTRNSLDELTATPEGKPYKDLLDNLFLQF